MGQFHKLSVLIQYEQMPLINANAKVSSEGRDLNFGLNLQIHPYFVYASRIGSGKSAHMCRFARDSDCSLCRFLIYTCFFSLLSDRS